MLFVENLRRQIKKLLRVYPNKLNKEIIIILNSADPTHDEAKYTKWLAQQYISGNLKIVDNKVENKNEIYRKLQLFDNYPNKFKNTNIYKLTVNDLLEADVSSGKDTINYKHLLKLPNRLIKQIGPYKLIEINEYSGMEQFKKESKTVPTKWCVAYPDKFDLYGPPIFMVARNDKPYVMIVYHEDEIKDINNKVISTSDFNILMDNKLIDVQQLPFTVDGDSKYFVNFIADKLSLDFDDLLKFDKPVMLIYYGKKHKLSKHQYDIIRNIIARKNNSLLAYAYAKELVGGRDRMAEQIILNNKSPFIAAQYAIDVIKNRWPEAEPIIRQSDYALDIYEEHFNI